MSAIFTITIKGTLYEVYHSGNIVLRVVKYYADSQVAREVHLDELHEPIKQVLLDAIKRHVDNSQ